MTRRVVITGMGVISPLGQSVDEAWRRTLAGESGISRLERFNDPTLEVRIAAEIKDWQPERYMPTKDARRRDRNQQYSYAAAHEALAMSGLTIDNDNRDRIGVIIGSAVGGIESYFNEMSKVHETGDLRRVTPFGIPMLLVNGGSNQVSIDIGACGRSATPISACATGADCIGYAVEMIRFGRLDAVIAGGAEAPISPIGMAAFDRTGACSRENDAPERASRPFDRSRAGLVFSEGAGVLVLEALEMAQARGATILGEIIGYGSTSDGYHITAPDPEGRGAATAIRLAIEDAGIAPEQIDHINAHGTGTILNDATETKAIKLALGAHAAKPVISATKSMTGHGMGATAAIEAIFVALALRDQIAPPTINLHDPDPECDLNLVALTARQAPMTIGMTNSFGFGGHNACLILKRYDA